jgi:4-amino-4-deoxy-L-arabinose transferase-like glycosyltransferase
MEKRARTWIFVAIFACGAGIRALDLGHGIDGGIRESWREADYGAVARNFIREGMDVRRPRIDWRGEGPGFAEMEFPAIPWAMAALYRVFGFHEIYGRLISYVFGLLTLLVFFALARRLLPDAGALFASGLFALAPLSVRVSNAIQPESVMLFFYISAVLAFLRWREKETGARWLIALLATAGAVLIKIPAAHIGVFFVLLIVREKGWRGLLKARVISFGVLALLPAAVWYAHAHRLWLEFGNSLGVSNESHWIGLDMFLQPRWIAAAVFRSVRMEAALVATLPGLIAAPVILWRKRRDPAAWTITAWLIGLAVYYLVTIRTTGDNWASYYHVVSAAPAALLFGLGFAAWAPFAASAARFQRAVAAVLLLSVLPTAAVQILGVRIPGTAGMAMAVMVFAAAAAWAAGAGSLKPPLSAALPVLLLAIPLLLGLQTARELHPVRYADLYAGARSFAPLIPPGALILASGGNGIEPTGRPTAYNASYMFYWLDRKGFNIPRERQTLGDVAGYVHRGAHFFVLEKESLKYRPEFGPELTRTYRLAGECAAAFLFDLSAPPAQSDLR